MDGVVKIKTTFNDWDMKTFEIDGDEYALYAEEKTVYSEGLVAHDMHFRKIIRIKGNVLAGNQQRLKIE